MTLAPMADVTDAAYRRIIAKYGKPDVMFTEFVSADGIFLSDVVGREKLMKDLLFTEAERPIVAQFFTSKPEMMKMAAELAGELGFDGVDINMGCPDRSIEKQGAGAALMKNSKLARDIIRGAKEGAGKLPVSVKTRIGYNKNEIEEWLPALLLAEPAAITIHGRTRKEMSKVAAHWDVIARAVEIRDEKKSKTLIFGNGDVVDLSDAREKARASRVDGVMLGRAIFGNPWLFSNHPQKEENTPSLSKEGVGGGVTIEEKLKALVEHTKLFEEILGDIKNFAVMKKHYKAYVQGFEGAKELRIKLMGADNVDRVEAIIGDYLNT